MGDTMDSENEPTEMQFQASRELRPTWKRQLPRLAILLAVNYAAICIALVCMETRLVFPGAYMEHRGPGEVTRFNSAHPVDGEVTSLAYHAEDGAELLGRIAARQHPDRVILFLHGNGIRAADLDPWTRRLSDTANATVLTAEYRGFQQKGFTPTEASTIADAVSAIDALSNVTGVTAANITIYGRSLGGGIAAGLVAAMQERGDPPKSLILDRTFDSAMQVGADRYFWLPVRWLIRNPYDSSERLRNFRGNVVSSHGPPDQIVPMKNGRALFDSLTTAHKTWIEVPDLSHNDRMSDETLRQEFEALRALEEQSSDVQALGPSANRPVPNEPVPNEPVPKEPVLK